MTSTSVSSSEQAYCQSLLKNVECLVALEKLSSALIDAKNVKGLDSFVQAWSLQEKQQTVAMMDRRLNEGDGIDEQVERVIGIALLCTQDSPQARPSMSRVAAMLKGEESIPKLPKRPEAARSLGLNDLNVSGTFTSTFVTMSVPFTRKLSLRWGSRKQRGPSAKLNDTPVPHSRLS